jgi:drug/metabolite transporter (DMT)-like permease
VLFGERLPWVAWLGMALVVAAGVLAVRVSNAPRPDSL